MDGTDLSAVPFILDTQAGRQLAEDSVVVVDCPSATYRLLNASGSHLWSLIDGQRTIGELRDSLAATYQLDDEQALRDVVSFLKNLETKGMVQWKQLAQ